jgi:hypothetical protein
MSSKAIAKELKDVIAEGEGEHLGIFGGEYHMQFSTSAKDAKKLFVDAVSNAHLMPKDQLSPEKIKKIKELGFEQKSSKENFSMVILNAETQVDKLSQLAVKVMTEIYGVKPAQIELDSSLSDD